MHPETCLGGHTQQSKSFAVHELDFLPLVLLNLARQGVLRVDFMYPCPHPTDLLVYARDTPLQQDLDEDFFK